MEEIKSGLFLGIDASNIRGGGGVTHLVELLSHAKPPSVGIEKVFLWGGAETLSKLPDRTWLIKINPTALNGGLLVRSWWQKFNLSKAAKAARCDVLFVPGGSYAGNFRPVITMSQNVLPFDWRMILRYGMSRMTLKLVLLRYVQSMSFKRSDGLIFLSNYAKQVVFKATGKINGKTTIIPHGISSRFHFPPKFQYPISEYSETKPYRLLYVSIIDEYKNQLQVVDAVNILRNEGYPLEIEFVGPAYYPALIKLKTTMSRLDPLGEWLYYRGGVPHEELHSIYESVDLGVFASCCENMPIILLETMAAGLPVACSNRASMPEVLGDAGLYFDPEDPIDIAMKLRMFIDSDFLRNEKSQASHERSKQYSWDHCAHDTMSFIVKIIYDK
jgi:glycosyltransferase involved in cell wall biosynthesis